MILVIDNYDSFTYNLVQYLGQCQAEIEVVRNDEITVEDAAARGASGIMLSPGPCTPKESGVCLDILSAALGGHEVLSRTPIFGVCLGMEAMGEVTGGTIRTARTIKHGKASPCEHDGQGVFQGMPNPFQVIRYHSLVIDEGSLRDDFVATARSLDDGELMGIRHRELPIEGVQFHPESIDTEEGFLIVKNFYEWAEGHRSSGLA